MQGGWSLAAVIPTHNRATLIGRALDSVLAQRRPPDEIIVVDDGSTDGTAEVVDAYGDRVTLISKTNGGVSSARNMGVRGSASDFVAFLDSDDLWYDDHLARVEHAIAGTAGNAGLYFSDLEVAPPRGNGHAWGSSGFSIRDRFELAEDSRPWLFRDIQPMTIQASVVRRDAYLAVGGCSTELSCREDTHLFFRLGIETPVCAVTGVAGMLSGDSPDSLTRTFPPTHETYWRCTAFMYRDILDASGDRLTVDQRQVLARRLGEAHWMLARNSGARAPRSAVRHLVDATRLDPALVPRHVGRALARATKRF